MEAEWKVTGQEHTKVPQELKIDLTASWGLKGRESYHISHLRLLCLIGKNDSYF